MKKITFFILISLFFMVSCSKDTKINSTIETTDTSSSLDKYTIKFADNQNSTYISVLANKEFAKLVNLKSGGRITVEIYSDAELGSEAEVTEMVQTGDVEMERVNVAVLSNYYTDYNILMLPYLYKNSDQMFRVLESDYCYDFLNPKGSSNFIGLAWYDAGARNFYNSEKEIKTIEDFKDLNIRTIESTIMASYIESLGANAVSLPYEKINESFDSNIIDVAENNINSYVSEKHYEKAKYMTLDEHMRVPELIIINKDFYNSLSDIDKNILQEAAKEASLLQRELWKESETKAIDTAILNGVIFTELTADEKSKIQETSVKIYNNYLNERSNLVDKLLSIK